MYSMQSSECVARWLGVANGAANADEGVPRGRRKSQGLTLKEKAHFVFKNRYLIVKRRDNLSESEEATLATMFAYQPGLKTGRTFMDKVFLCYSPRLRRSACPTLGCVGLFGAIRLLALASFVPIRRQVSQTSSGHINQRSDHQLQCLFSHPGHTSPCMHLVRMSGLARDFALVPEWTVSYEPPDPDSVTCSFPSQRRRLVKRSPLFRVGNLAAISRIV